MTIAQKSGSLIIKDGKVASACNCCGQVLGVCCRQDEAFCQSATESECAALGWEYKGALTAENNCDQCQPCNVLTRSCPAASHPLWGKYPLTLTAQVTITDSDETFTACQGTYTLQVSSASSPNCIDYSQLRQPSGTGFLRCSFYLASGWGPLSVPAVDIRCNRFFGGPASGTMFGVGPNGPCVPSYVPVSGCFSAQADLYTRIFPVNPQPCEVVWTKRGSVTISQS